ncbi:hypothetical protein C0991_007945, partial [Blastosporella zonata]
MKQSVKLDGLGLASFEDAIGAASKVCKHFDREFEAGQLEQWTVQRSSNENPVIDIASRIFVPVADLKATEPHIPFSNSINPFNIGANAEANGFRHTEDNAVEYTEMKMPDKGKIR